MAKADRTIEINVEISEESKKRLADLERSLQKAREAKT